MERQRAESLSSKLSRVVDLPITKHFHMNMQKSIKFQYSGKGNKKNVNYQRISSIKNVCLEKLQSNSKASQKTKKKSYSLADEQDLDTSCIQSQQQDDAIIQKSLQNESVMLKSKFEGRPKTILFRYPKCCQKQHDQANLLKINRITKVNQLSLVYRIYGSEYKCILNAFQFNGFKKTNTNKDWHVFFDVRGSKVRTTCMTMNQKQKFNHFAGCWHLGRKDQMWWGVNKLRKLFPLDYNFIPKTFIFPYDYEHFQNTRQMSQKNQLWIQKPVASSRGRNIKVIKNQTKISNHRGTLVSQYICNPHLINLLKYDLRIYVLVTSFNPLKIYIYENGLARFATQHYKKTGKKQKFIHLTNFSVNKHSKNFIYNKNTENPQEQSASKWSIFKLKQYYSKIGIDSNYIFKQIQDVVIKTCISAEPSMLAPKYRNEDKKGINFQLFGFDILIDQKLKAWLMEVNVCPSLCSSSPFDRKLKHTLIVDLLNLVGINHPDTNVLEETPQSPKVNEKKRYKFKNPNSILNLNYQNCLQLLSPEDWLIIFENEEQLDRMSLGNFQRAFPRKDNILTYKKYFQCPRYNNFVLWSNILSSKNFLNKIIF